MKLGRLILTTALSTAVVACSAVVNKRPLPITP